MRDKKKLAELKEALLAIENPKTREICVDITFDILNDVLEKYDAVTDILDAIIKVHDNPVDNKTLAIYKDMCCEKCYDATVALIKGGN